MTTLICADADDVAIRRANDSGKAGCGLCSGSLSSSNSGGRG